MLTMLSKMIGKDKDLLYTAIRGREVLLDKNGMGLYVEKGGKLGEYCFLDISKIDGQPITLDSAG